MPDRLPPRRATTLWIAIGAFALAVPPAAAQDSGARKVGAWTVAPGQDGAGCLLSRSYRGPTGTTLILGLDTDGSQRLSVLNPDWSIRPGDRERLTFRLGAARYDRQFAVGIASAGKQGFAAEFDAAFAGKLAAAKSLAIARGTTPVEDLPLDGSGAAVRELKACVAALGDGRGASRSSDDAGRSIPRDPFARDSKPLRND